MLLVFAKSDDDAIKNRAGNKEKKIFRLLILLPENSLI